MNIYQRFHVFTIVIALTLFAVTYIYCGDLFARTLTLAGSMWMLLAICWIVYVRLLWRLGGTRENMFERFTIRFAVSLACAFLTCVAGFIVASVIAHTFPAHRYPKGSY
jgi:hypothetical protein